MIIIEKENKSRYLYWSTILLLDFSLTVKAAPHECVMRTSQP